jgi:hypothetical protein
MTFSLTYLLGGYAVLGLVVVLFVDWECAPVQRTEPPARHDRARLRPWPRTARRCPVTHENALPLRSAQLAAAPARRRRPTPTSCRR